MKRPFFMSITFIVIVVLLALFTACGDSGGSSSSSDGPYTVRYEISGPEAISSQIMYYETGNSHNFLYSVSLPWEKQMTVSGKYIPLFCNAYLPPFNANTYTAKIFVNGNEVASETSSGSSITVSYAIQ